MKIWPTILGAALGTVSTATILYLNRKKDVDNYISRLLNSWIIVPAPRKVPIKKLAILSIELARYMHGKATPDKIMSSTRNLKNLALELDYKLTTKQWSKVRIAARKLLRGTNNLATLATVKS